jgi:predicted MPP superfamily phosphohydrolase
VFTPFELPQAMALAAPVSAWVLVCAPFLGRRAGTLAASAATIPWVGFLLWWQGYSPGVTIAWMAMVTLVPVGASLPVAILLRPRRKKLAAPTPDASPRMGRRALLLQGASSAVPLVAAAAGPASLWQAAGDVSARRIPLPCSRLPEALDGMCILHLSDLHLGASKSTADLQRFLKDVPLPDLVLLTGDVADDLDELRRGLSLLGDFGPPVFACLGNHEYLHGIDRMLPPYLEGRVRLLRDEHVVLHARGTTVVVAGIDDPVQKAWDAAYFDRAIDRALEGSPKDAFRILLSHRPKALDSASERGVGLVLSGHTHGGQLGLLGRSVLEPFYPGEYLWGRYERAETTLYTSSGFGHWFPFRLGCPTEAPQLVLSR